MKTLEVKAIKFRRIDILFTIHSRNIAYNLYCHMCMIQEILKVIIIAALEQLFGSSGPELTNFSSWAMTYGHIMVELSLTSLKKCGGYFLQ